MKEEEVPCWSCQMGKGECMCNDLQERNKFLEEVLGDVPDFMEPIQDE